MATRIDDEEDEEEKFASTKGRKGEESAAMDPAFRRLLEAGGLDDRGETAQWMRSQLGTYEAADVAHLRELREGGKAAERHKRASELAAFETLRAEEAAKDEAAREHRARQTGAAAAAAVAAPARTVAVSVQRAEKRVATGDTRGGKKLCSEASSVLAGLADYGGDSD